MIVLNYPAPAIWGLSGWQMGEALSPTGDISVVASGALVGSYPTWESEYTYSGGYANRYYALRFETDTNDLTAWTGRTIGSYEALDYFKLYLSDDTVYVVPPSVSGVVIDWLSWNSEYTVTIDQSLWGSGTTYMRDSYSFFFTSRYNPHWSTVTAVRLAAGPLIEAIPDDTINRMIYRMSLKAITNFMHGVNTFGIDWDAIPEPVFRWVTCSAGLMALNAAIAAGLGGNVTKRLGEFQVTYDKRYMDPGQIRKNLSDCVEEAANIIGSLMGTRVVSAIKGLKNAYLTHPFTDPAWGRFPRSVLIQTSDITGNPTKGPWIESQDFKYYERATPYLPQSRFFPDRFSSVDVPGYASP